MHIHTGEKHEKPKKSNSVGVIVARFQVPELHSGHRYLVDYVRARHTDVLIVLGGPGGARTPDNPLTFDERRYMIKKTYPAKSLDAVYLPDHSYSHKLWSRNLDSIISGNYPGKTAVLYGSRNSFIPLYTGRFPTKEVRPVRQDSGTAVRRSITFPHTRQAREAIIFSQNDQKTRYPTAYSTADIGIIDEAGRRVLLITKPAFDGLWAFPGGFVDPMVDENDEAAAKRERTEEVRNIMTGGFVQMGPRLKVDDPRYRRSSDKIYTTLFRTTYLGGSPLPGDDAQAVRWFNIRDLREVLVPWHRPHSILIEVYMLENERLRA